MTSSDNAFYEYYANESAAPSTLARFVATKAAVLRAAGRFGVDATACRVGDIGCGAGTQSLLWAADGHEVRGIDINQRLVDLGRRRAAEAGFDVQLTVGSATDLPWADRSLDICLCPELLEHVADWKCVVSEAARVTRPGGLLYFSTTNRLCPVQHEFNLPAYSWYPGRIKRYCERLARTTRPELANHAKYPAVNWFTYYRLRDHLASLGFDSMDRFDAASAGGNSAVSGTLLAVIRNVPAARLIGHILTPYTAIFAYRRQP